MPGLAPERWYHYLHTTSSCFKGELVGIRSKPAGIDAQRGMVEGANNIPLTVSLVHWPELAPLGIAEQPFNVY